MKTHLKTIAIAAVAAVSLGGLSVPASAAAPNDHRYEQIRHSSHDRSIDRRIDNIDARINQGRRSGALNRSEANRLNSDLRDIKSLARRYERSGRGIDRQEASVLERRMNALEHRLMAELRDRRSYGYRR